MMCERRSRETQHGDTQDHREFRLHSFLLKKGDRATRRADAEPKQKCEQSCHSVHQRTVTSFLGLSDFAEYREIKYQSDGEKHHLSVEPLALEITGGPPGEYQRTAEEHEYEAGRPRNGDVLRQLSNALRAEAESEKSYAQ